MSVRCDHTFETVDALLKRNWFMDIQDVFDLLNELPEDVYWQVVENRDAYPGDISWVLYEPDVPHRMQVVDYDFEIEDTQRELTRRELIKNHRAAFVAPQRPLEWVDADHESLRLKIEKTRETIEELKSRYLRSRKYILPSQRQDAYERVPEIQDATRRLASLENEFALATERIDSVNKTWSELKWLDAVLMDAAKRPSFLSSVHVNESSVSITAPQKTIRADTTSKPLESSNLRNIIQRL
jgi:hypothetical protein